MVMSLGGCSFSFIFFQAVGRPFLSRNACTIVWKNNPKLYLDYFLPSIFLLFFLLPNIWKCHSSQPDSLFFSFLFPISFFSASWGISSIFISKTTIAILTSGIICLISKMLVVVLSPGHVQLFVTPWIATQQASLSLIISQSLIKFMSIESVMLSDHLILCHPLPPLPSISPSIRDFSSESALLDGQSIGASASVSVLLMNSQCWFPLGLTGLISLQSKGLSRVFSNTTFFKSINTLAFSLLYGPTFTSIHDYWKSRSFDYTDLFQQTDVSAF